MTQLDRLEALAEKWQKQGLMARETKIALDALPDLIRVARAGVEMAFDLDPDTSRLSTARFHQAAAPLFAEVES